MWRDKQWCSEEGMARGLWVTSPLDICPVLSLLTRVLEEKEVLPKVSLCYKIFLTSEISLNQNTKIKVKQNPGTTSKRPPGLHCHSMLCSYRWLPRTLTSTSFQVRNPTFQIFLVIRLLSSNDIILNLSQKQKLHRKKRTFSFLQVLWLSLGDDQLFKVILSMIMLSA